MNDRTADEYEVDGVFRSDLLDVLEGIMYEIRELNVNIKELSK